MDVEMEVEDQESGIMYMCELSKRLYTLTIHVFDQNLSTQKWKFSYKWEDSEVLLKIDFQELPLQYIQLK